MKKHTFTDLLEIMAQLRDPEKGCPWDVKQTHETILNCLIEEAYEFLDAVRNKDQENMQEELGDILLQVVFHSQMAKEAGRFDVNDVIHVLVEKLITRHPHVFGSEKAETADQVKLRWDEIKAQEKKTRTKVLDGIPVSLPPLHKAEKIQKKVKKVGFEWPDYKGPLNKIKEELGELEDEIMAMEKGEDVKERISEELGDLLFSVVNLGRHLKVDPSGSLEKTNQKFISRFTKVEQMVEDNKLKITELSLEELDKYWEQAKKG